MLLYDAGCRLCRFAARLVAALDRRGELALLGLDDAAADRLLEDVPGDERLSSIRLVQPDGHVLSGGAAALCTLDRLPVARLLAWAVTALRARRAVESAYAMVARNRRRLGRLVPDGPAPRRYP